VSGITNEAAQRAAGVSPIEGSLDPRGETSSVPIPQIRAPFRADFPNVVIHRPYGSAVRYVQHPDYAAAKAGDPEAAVRFVDAMVDPATMAELRAILGDRKPTVVAVHAEEAAGRNAIPERYAYVLARDFKLPLDEDIVQANRTGRTGQSGEYRLAVHAEFDGPLQPGRDYLIVDDNVTQGGTPADLRSYIETRGGYVVGATTLTGSRQSEMLASVPELESRWKAAFGYGFSSLTQGEAAYLLRSPKADFLEDRVIARAQERTAPQIQGD
jgi:adenine/guanine phosphoribosyltransferase-like PRPP-binding protein